MTKQILFALVFICLALFNSVAGDVTTKDIDSMAYKAREIQDNDPQGALSLAQDFLVYAEQINYEKGKGYALVRIGSIYGSQRKNDSALFYLRKALALRVGQNDFRGASGVCIELNYVYKQTGNLDSAYSVLLYASRLNGVSGDTNAIIDTYLELGHFSTTYRDSSTALFYYRKALKLSEQQNWEQGIIYSNSGLGNFYYKNLDYANALHYFLLAHKRLEQTDNLFGLAKSANNLALCYQELNNTGEAIKEYKNSLRIYLELGLDHNKALIYNNLGELYQIKEIPDSSVHYTELALPYYIQAKDISGIANCYKKLSIAEASRGNYEEAFVNQVRFNKLNDSLLDIKKVTSISEMRTKYDTEKKEQKIELLDQENKTKSAQQKLLIISLLLLVIVITTLGYFYVQRNKLAKKEKELSDEKIINLLKEQELNTNNAMIEGQNEERQRIANDLHDRLGGMLSTIKLLFSSLEDKVDKNISESQNQYTKASSLIDEAVTEVRRISHNLNTGVVANFGLVVALEELCNTLNLSQPIQFKLMTYGIETRLDANIAIELYRMIQEIINNILKHSKASKVTIQLNQMETSLSVTVEDNGVGFDPKKIESTGMGLKSIENRAAKIKGVYHVDSTIGSGSISIIEIPISDEREN